MSFAVPRCCARGRAHSVRILFSRQSAFSDRLSAQQGYRTLRDFFHRPETPHAFVATGQHTLLRPDKFRATLFQDSDILLRGGVLPHLAVHGWRDEQLRLRIQRQRNASERVVCKTIRQFRDAIRRRRRDEQDVSFIRETDVCGFPAFFLIVEIGDDGITRERLERQRRDKFLRVSGEHHANVAASLCQQAREIGGLVRRDGSRDPKNDIFTFAHVDREVQNSGATDLGVRIFSASTIACMCRKSSATLRLMIR